MSQADLPKRERKRLYNTCDRCGGTVSVKHGNRVKSDNGWDHKACEGLDVGPVTDELGRPIDKATQRAARRHAILTGDRLA